MALTDFGVPVPQEPAQLLSHIPGAGTPARNILQLSRYGVSVLYQQNDTLEDLEQEIRKDSVVILFVRTGELPYWEDVPYAVVVSGMEAGILYLTRPFTKRRSLFQKRISFSPGTSSAVSGQRWLVVREKNPCEMERAL